MKQVRDAIPKHCWEKSVVKSMSYVFMDLSMIATLVVLASQITYLPSIYQIPAWIAYSVMQGIVGVGIWILAHGNNERVLI